MTLEQDRISVSCFGGDDGSELGLGRNFADAALDLLFFTGKGGVGKSSLACATALTLADQGKSVLLVSTDPASNLDEMLGQKLSSQPTGIPGAHGLFGLNIDPVAAADAYRQRVVAQMSPDTSDEELATVREELAGACTTEIASFGEFVNLLAENTVR